jgi:hypothetical protein
MKTRWLAFGATFCFGGLACAPPPSASQVADRTGTQTAALVQEANEALRAIAEMSALRTLTNGYDVGRRSAVSSSADGGVACRPDAGAGVACQPYPETSSPPKTIDDQQLREATEKIVAFLRDRVFTEANIEKKEGSAAVFRLHGDDLCTDGSAPASPTCMSQVDALEIRIQATQLPNDGLELKLLVSPHKYAPLIVQLAKANVAVQAELAQSKLALDFAYAQMQQSGKLPRHMEGLVEVRLEKKGELDFVLSSSVLKPVRVELDDITSFSTEARSPYFSIRAEGRQKRLSVLADVGRTVLVGPYAQGNPAFKPGTRLTADVSGLSMSFSAAEGVEEFNVAHIGIGDARSTVALDDEVLFAADLNESSNRHFDIALRRADDGLPIFRIAPQFDLVTKFFLQPLKVDTAQNIPSYFEDQTYRMLLTGGAAQVVKPVAANPSTDFPGGLKVVEGTLTLSSSQPGAPAVVVEAGQCLVGQRASDGGVHPLLGQVLARPCP